MQKGQPGVRKPSARPTPAIISVFRPFRYFVKVGGIAVVGQFETSYRPGPAHGCWDR
jgi:hypothetical protein